MELFFLGVAGEKGGCFFACHLVNLEFAGLHNLLCLFELFIMEKEIFDFLGGPFGFVIFEEIGGIKQMDKASVHEVFHLPHPFAVKRNPEFMPDRLPVSCYHD